MKYKINSVVTYSIVYYIIRGKLSRISTAGAAALLFCYPVNKRYTSHEGSLKVTIFLGFVSPVAVPAISSIIRSSLFSSLLRVKESRRSTAFSLSLR